MKIALIVEGRTEKAFLPVLREFLGRRLPASPKIDPVSYDGPIPKGEKLRRDVEKLLNGSRAADHVLALTDVYTGKRPPEFHNAAHAKAKMREWVGNESRFHPHAAQYDFEAWLLPYWPTIQRMAGHNRACPSGDPESVNHNTPPSRHIKEIFEIGKCRDSYVKVRDAIKILRQNDLALAVEKCAELKALVNTILNISGSQTIP